MNFAFTFVKTIRQIFYKLLNNIHFCEIKSLNEIQPETVY